MVACENMRRLSDEQFREYVKSRGVLDLIESVDADCFRDELEARDMVIKISKNMKLFVSKVTRYGEVQKAFAEMFGGLPFEETRKMKGRRLR